MTADARVRLLVLALVIFAALAAVAAPCALVLRRREERRRARGRALVEAQRIANGDVRRLVMEAHDPQHDEAADRE